MCLKNLLATPKGAVFLSKIQILAPCTVLIKVNAGFL